MLLRFLLFILLTSSLGLISCGEKSSSTKEIKKGPPFFYLYNLIKLRNDLKKIQQRDITFKILENHQAFPEGDPMISCNDEDINRLYESFLAKNILLNADLSFHISSVFKKIFEMMNRNMLDSSSNSVFQSASKIWSNDPLNVYL